MIAAESPLPSAKVKKAELITSLCGSPKETFETPSEVLQPSSLLIILIALSVSLAEFASALIVSASGSKIISFLSIPYFSAVERIFLAILILPSASAAS